MAEYSKNDQALEVVNMDVPLCFDQVRPLLVRSFREPIYPVDRITPFGIEDDAPGLLTCWLGERFTPWGRIYIQKRSEAIITLSVVVRGRGKGYITNEMKQVHEVLRATGIVDTLWNLLKV